VPIFAVAALPGDGTTGDRFCPSGFGRGEIGDVVRVAERVGPLNASKACVMPQHMHSTCPSTSMSRAANVSARAAREKSLPWMHAKQQRARRRLRQEPSHRTTALHTLHAVRPSGAMIPQPGADADAGSDRRAHHRLEIYAQGAQDHPSNCPDIPSLSNSPTKQGVRGRTTVAIGPRHARHRLTARPDRTFRASRTRRGASHARRAAFELVGLAEVGSQESRVRVKARSRPARRRHQRVPAGRQPRAGRREEARASAFDSRSR